MGGVVGTNEIVISEPVIFFKHNAMPIQTWLLLIQLSLVAIVAYSYFRPCPGWFLDLMFGPVEERPRS
jgi:hypothetical protein